MTTYRLLLPILFLTVSTGGALLAVEPPAEMHVDGVPEIPEDLVERVQQFQNARAASFRSWHPTKREMLIATRFGNTVQAHYLAQPGGSRRQLTFFQEPVTPTAMHRGPTENYFLFSMDKGGSEFFQNYRFDLDTGRHQVKGGPRMIPAFVLKPAAKFTGPRPVLIDIHGGPEGQARPAFQRSSTLYLLNELGVAVIQPNVRGSSGYGKSYLLLDNGVKREDSVKDIGALLEWIKTRNDLDASRVAVIGGSYGGYMSLAAMTHYSDKLKCGVELFGISHFGTFLKNTQGYRRHLRRAEYGDENDPTMWDFFETISPLNNAEKIKIPMLVFQGKNDPRVPYTESEQIVAKVRSNGGEVWYLLADNEGHGLANKPNRDYFDYASLTFLNRCLVE